MINVSINLTDTAAALSAARAAIEGMGVSLKEAAKAAQAMGGQLETVRRIVAPPDPGGLYPCPRCASRKTRELRRTSKRGLVVLACDECGEVRRLKGWYQTTIERSNAHEARRLVRGLPLEGL